jgi:hypothetical protein
MDDVAEESGIQLSKQDVAALARKLREMGYALEALYEVGEQVDNGITPTAFVTLTEQTVKRGFAILDACLEKLGEAKIGLFEDELAD